MNLTPGWKSLICVNVPFHGQCNCDVDAAAEVDVPQGVEEVDDGVGVEQGQLDDEGLLDALQDGQKEEDAVERGEEDLKQIHYLMWGVNGFVTTSDKT